MSNTNYYMIFGGLFALLLISFGFWVWKEIEEYQFKKRLKEFQERQSKHHATIKAINWLQSPEGKLEVAKQFLFEL